MTVRLRHLFEAETKTAVASFGRLNPPTTGHNAMVDEIKKVPGDHFLFLSHSQGAKNPDAKPGTKAGENKDPLSFSEKLPLAKQAFPNVNVGYADVTKIFDMPVKLYKLGYKKLIIVAGNDRMSSYKSIFPKYNGVEGDHGYYKFDNIEFVELTRDEEAEGVEGMSASKLRQAVRNNDFESFKKGLIAGNPQQLFDTIKERLAVDSLGVKQEEPIEEPIEEPAKEGIGAMAKGAVGHVKNAATAGKLILKYDQTGREEDAFAAIKHGWQWIKNPKMRRGIVNLVKKYATKQGQDWPTAVAHIKKNTGIDVSNVNESRDTPTRDKEDYNAKRKALQDIQMDPNTANDPDLKKELIRRLASLEKNKPQEIAELKVQQQRPKIEVMYNIADRKDNKPFPLSYKDTGGASTGGQVMITPQQAQKFIKFYEQRADDEKILMQKALSSVSGTMNLLKNLGMEANSILPNNPDAEVKSPEEKIRANLAKGV